MRINFNFSPEEQQKFCHRQLYTSKGATKLKGGVELNEQTEVFRGSIDSMKK